MQDKALELGLLREEPYDPKRHGEPWGSEYVKRGEPWFVFSEMLTITADNQRNERGTMTDEEEIAKAARIIMQLGRDCVSRAGEILAPHLAKIQDLEAEVACHKGNADDIYKKWVALKSEVAALRQRLVVDNEMVERALETFLSQGFSDGPEGDRAQIKEMLIAALGKDDANG